MLFTITIKDREREIFLKKENYQINRFKLIFYNLSRRNIQYFINQYRDHFIVRRRESMIFLL